MCVIKFINVDGVLNFKCIFIAAIVAVYYEFPPFTGKHCPVMKLDQSESRKMITSATSVAYAILPLGINATCALPTATLGSSRGAPATIASASGVSVAPNFVNSRSHRRRTHEHLPGATKFTRSLGKSRAHDLVSPRTACLEAVYAAIPGTPRRDAPLPTMTIEPCPTLRTAPVMTPGASISSCADMRRMASVAMFQVPVTLTSIVLWNISSVPILPSQAPTPAELTSPSSRPGMEPRKDSASLRFVTSH